MKTVNFILIFFVLYARGEEESKDRWLSIPKAALCSSRLKDFQYKGRNYFYSGFHPDLKDKKLDWLDSRNTCRDYCMETVSFETEDKYEFMKAYIEKNNISFIWTSGRLCDFDGCEGRWDLLPKRIKGWLWSANQVRIDDTNKVPKDWNYNPWSRTGHLKKPQPDNAEFYLSQTSESCLGILNNHYNDSITWHDIACYHKARFICEDSEILLNDVKEKSTENDKTNLMHESKESTASTTSINPQTVESTTISKFAESTTQKYDEITKKHLEPKPQEKRRKNAGVRRKLVRRAKKVTRPIVEVTTYPVEVMNEADTTTNFVSVSTETSTVLDSSTKKSPFRRRKFFKSE